MSYSSMQEFLSFLQKHRRLSIIPPASQFPMKCILQHNNRYSYWKKCPFYRSMDHCHMSKNHQKNERNRHQINRICSLLCFFCRCKRRYTLQGQYIKHQFSFPCRLVVLRGRVDLLALDNRLSSWPCLSSNNSDGSSVVVSGHGVRFAGTTMSKGGSITHLQNCIFSCRIA